MQIKASLFLGVAALSLSATTAFAQTAQTATVTAQVTVTPACSFASPAIPLTFPAVLNNTTTDATTTATLTFRCSTNTSYTLMMGASSLRIAGSQNNTMTQQGVTAPATPAILPYSISWAAIPNPQLVGGGFTTAATPTTVTLNGTITSANIQNVVPGTYRGTVTVTLTPV